MSRASFVMASQWWLKKWDESERIWLMTQINSKIFKLKTSITSLTSFWKWPWGRKNGKKYLQEKKISAFYFHSPWQKVEINERKRNMMIPFNHIAFIVFLFLFSIYTISRIFLFWNVIRKTKWKGNKLVVDAVVHIAAISTFSSLMENGLLVIYPHTKREERKNNFNKIAK